MIPSHFVYCAPASPTEAAGLLANDPTGSCLLGGGTWVVPDLNRGVLTPRVVIDLGQTGLNGIDHVDGVVRIGAMCSYADLLRSQVIVAHCPLLELMSDEITGGAQIRNRGTLGGSVAAARSGFDAPQHSLRLTPLRC